MQYDGMSCIQAALIGGGIEVGGGSPFKPEIPPIKLLVGDLGAGARKTYYVERSMSIRFWREMLSIE